MIDFVNNLINTLNRPDNHVIIVIVFLSVVLLNLLLRIFGHIHFKGALVALRVDVKKEYSARTDVKNLRYPLLRKAAAEYIRTAERAVGKVPAEEITKMVVGKMNFIGWRYSGLLPFITGLEYAFLLIGLVMALVFPGYAALYGVLSVGAFLLCRILSAFFNVTEAKDELIREMTLFLEREIGRFFASDSGGAILRLKNDLTEAINNQAASYIKSMDTISTTMQNTLKEVSQGMIAAADAIGPLVAKSMEEKIINMNDALSKTVTEWEKAIGESGVLQKNMNETSSGISHAATKLQSGSELMATHLQGHSKAQSEQLMSLVTAVESVKEVVSSLNARQDTLIKQGEFIEKNQAALDSALALYEASLQNLTQTLGTALGAYINLHTQTASEKINETLTSNVDRIVRLSKGGAE